MVKKGDTLIEVTIAIGIFSMVAIAVVSVMSSGSSNAQTALETTLTREEIDAQAEALRFIHAAYLAGDEKYATTWEDYIPNWGTYKMTDDEEKNNEYTQFNPTSCDEIYKDKSFIIDPNKLTFYAYKGHEGLFDAPSTYPHIIYNDDGTIIRRVEGLYVLAVKPNSGTSSSAYYDFYIRACWYGAGSKAPSTISTVIRLYDPEGLK